MLRGVQTVAMRNLHRSKSNGIKWPVWAVDQGDGVGRLDVLQLKDGSALVSWVDWVNESERLFVCRAQPKIGCGNLQMITLNDVAGSIKSD